MPDYPPTPPTFLTPRSGPRVLPLAAYRDAVDLDTPFRPTAAPAPADRLDDHVREALRLMNADPAIARLGLAPGSLPELKDPATARQVLRALLTVRDPGPLPEGTDAELDALLGGERLLRETTAPAGLPTPDGRTSLWRGDLTTLAADAIVNAANSGLLGCFRPLHPCIDNAIHSAAGPRLRDDCKAVYDAQGAPEPTGVAKVTRAYHLPTRYVLHTVGPVVQGRPAPSDARALASSYRACLDLAAELDDVRTVGLCAVSTGVFGYPKDEAAPLAVHTVTEWLDAHPGRFDRVVFTVFTEEDERAYRRVLDD
ncbi:macro domain-containing protein [Streptomyces roseirectus]|uniref:Macro domain-containing protein n=1 Tax=Streptomyces roseirectus TaxID=2768066 RepID=A0A7H0IAT4_9ACTN|nr:macro domain-containing protein [Streptomyces roseirectus]QNP69900.1 macro domain-containing protein [Streptomyces roseirectus]